jgi:hypothetical protein
MGANTKNGQCTTVPRASIGATSWNEFVDADPDGWFFHRWAWLDYSLKYTPGSVDRSVAVLRRGDIIAVCPMIDEGGRIAMGGEPCVGPVGFAGIHHWRFAADRLPETFAWRWTDPSMQARVIIASLGRVPGVERSDWSTVVQKLQGPQDERWQTLRKSYRATIRRAEKDWRIAVGGVEKWDWYADCHQAVATRPRSAATYEHQREMVRSGRGRIAVALDASGACIAAVLAFVHQGRAYYASGPSKARGVQHAVLWAMSNHLAVEGVGEFEIGWTGQPGANANIEFFKRGFGDDLRPVVVLSRS